MTPYDVPDSIENWRLLDIHAIGFRVIELDKPSSTSEACNCSSLKDFILWDYSNGSHDDEIFINDNQTIIGNNYSAWQTETMSAPSGLETKSLVV